MCDGYKFSNTFINIARYTTFIYQHCQQYYNDTYFIQLSEVGVGATVVLVTCLSCYTYAPCCQDSSHMVGMDAGSSGNILASLVQMKKHIRTFLTKENLSQLKLVDPIQLMEGVAVEGHMDPVHPPDELYDKLAVRLTTVLEGDGKPSLEVGLEPDPKRTRLLSYGTGRGGARSRWAV